MVSVSVSVEVKFQVVVSVSIELKFLVSVSVGVLGIGTTQVQGTWWVDGSRNKQWGSGGGSRWKKRGVGGRSPLPKKNVYTQTRFRNNLSPDTPLFFTGNCCPQNNFIQFCILVSMNENSRDETWRFVFTLGNCSHSALYIYMC